MKSLPFIFVFLFLVSCQKKEMESKNETPKTPISNTLLERVEPPNWFIDFKDTSLQLLVKEENIGNSKPTISYEGVSIIKVNKAKSIRKVFTLAKE